MWVGGALIVLIVMLIFQHIVAVLIGILVAAVVVGLCVVVDMWIEAGERRRENERRATLAAHRSRVEWQARLRKEQAVYSTAEQLLQEAHEEANRDIDQLIAEVDGEMRRAGGEGQL